MKTKQLLPVEFYTGGDEAVARLTGAITA